MRSSGVRVDYRSTATFLGSGRAGLIGSSWRYARALDSFLDAEQGSFDLLHAHFGFPDAVVAERAARKRNLPLVITLHGDDALKVLPRKDALGGIVRRAVRGAAATICVSDAMAKAVTREMGGDASVVTITNGFDADTFRLSNRERDLGILFVGLLVPVKNLDVLLRAYASVRESLGVPLVIAGDGPLRAELQALAASLDLSDRVRFTGEATRAEVADLMSRAHCLVLPSKSEGWPLVVTESLAIGTPVVASNVGGIPEIVTTDDAGILVEPGDERALADALVRCSRTPHDPSRVAAASGARSWAQQAHEIAGVYRSAVARRSAS